jgi:hypothetical protein
MALTTKRIEPEVGGESPALRSMRAGLEPIKQARQLTAPVSPER